MGINDFIKELLFPKICFGCKRIGSYLCHNCAKSLIVINKDVCVYCGRASFFGLTHPKCKTKTGIDGLKSIFLYNNMAKKVISMIKYKFVFDAVDTFMKAIPEKKLKEVEFVKKIIPKSALIVPVPLHSDRQAKRGFNQSEKYGLFFSSLLNLPLSNKAISRVKNTKSQVNMKTPRERFENIRRAFEVNSADLVSGREVIIVDDVWTTGSTIKETSRTLKRCGAGRIIALTLARAHI